MAIVPDTITTIFKIIGRQIKAACSHIAACNVSSAEEARDYGWMVGLVLGLLTACLLA